MSDPEEVPPSSLETQVFRIEDVMARQAARQTDGPLQEAARILYDQEATARFVLDLPPAGREPDAARMAEAILKALECLKEALTSAQPREGGPAD